MEPIPKDLLVFVVIKIRKGLMSLSRFRPSDNGELPEIMMGRIRIAIERALKPEIAISVTAMLDQRAEIIRLLELRNR